MSHPKYAFRQINGRLINQGGELNRTAQLNRKCNTIDAW